MNNDDSEQDLSLAKLDAVRLALEQATTVQEVKHVRDMARAAEVYAQQQKHGKEIQQQLAEYIGRAEHKLGEMLAAAKEAGQMDAGGRPPKKPVEDDDGFSATLKDLGISRDLSSRAQKLAAIPKDVFERLIVELTEAGGRVTSKSILQAYDRECGNGKKPRKSKPKATKYECDVAGVKPYIPDNNMAVRKWFWNQCEAVRLPFGSQAKLAAWLANEAVERNKGLLSLPFIKDYQAEFAITAKYPESDLLITKAQMDQILIEMDEEKLVRLAKELTSKLYAFGHAAENMWAFIEQVEKSVELDADRKAHVHSELSDIFDNYFRRFALPNVKKVVDKLVEKFPPKSRFGFGK